jgi:phosphate transport system substrate-binding protein
MIRFGSLAICAWSLLGSVCGHLAVGQTAQPVSGAAGTPRAALTQAVQPASPAAAVSSVDDLAAMLRLIDPYRPQEQATGTIRVYGSTAMDSMAHMWADQLKQFHPQVKVEISAAGSGDAFAQLKREPTAVAMLSRPVKAEELEALKAEGVKDPAAFVVGREALGVYVHASNPAQAISGEQLRLIFTTQGQERDLKWKLLGVSGSQGEQPIKLIARSETSGTYTFLRDFIFGGLQMRGSAVALESNNDVLSELAQDPLAITICGLRAGGTGVRPLPLVAGGEVINSDDAAVLSGQYPLTRDVTLVLDLGQTGPAAVAAREFVLFALCQLGQIDAIRAGFYPADISVLRSGMNRLNRGRIQ